MDPGAAGVTGDRIRVGLPAGAVAGSTGYDAVVGSGLLDDVGALVAEAVGGGQPVGRVVLVTSPAVGRRYGTRVREALAGHFAVDELVVDDGEQAKTLDTVAEVYRGFAELPLNRDGVVVALGGGVLGDLVGFAAATWNRGVRLVQVPTTLLAQVDSSIGGKTGVNVAEGKNLVGAFHQPLLVVCDVATLATLPQRELLAGLGEVAKYGFIADPAVLTILDERRQEAVAGDPAVLAELVRRSVAVKADVVGADERESGRRMVLNYGHTIGHAIESLTGYGRFRHGEAVGLGMIAAASVGEAMRVSPPGFTELTTGLLGRLGLPCGGAGVEPDAVWRTIQRDKKVAAGTVRMILCTRPGETTVVTDPPRAAVDEALARIA